MDRGPMGELLAYAPIWNEWDSIVGDSLAATMLPRAVWNGRLHVTISSHAMRHRLAMDKPAILAKINARLTGVCINDIVFDATDRD